jgi:hypothetical protein
MSRNSGSDSASEYGIELMRGVAKRQCDRILATLRGCCCARALTLGARQLLANLNLTTAATKLGPELGASPRSLLGLSADGYYSLPELLPPTGAHDVWLRPAPRLALYAC